MRIDKQTAPVEKINRKSEGYADISVHSVQGRRQLILPGDSAQVNLSLPVVSNNVDICIYIFKFITLLHTQNDEMDWLG